jgi:hypothetical protein
MNMQRKIFYLWQGVQMSEPSSDENVPAVQGRQRTDPYCFEK